MVDDTFAAALDSLKDEVSTELLEEFDQFLKKHEEKCAARLSEQSKL